VEAVIGAGQTIDAGLQAAEGTNERAAVRAIALGTVRWYLRLAPALEALLERPAGISAPVRALLACAAHQIEYSRNPPESVVNAAVDAARLLGQARAAPLCNAVLRRFVAERGALFARLDHRMAAASAHPEWLVQRLQKAWPGHASQMLEANNRHPPMILRVDLSRSTAAAYVQQLQEAHIDAREIQWMPSGVILEHPRGVNDLPGFAEGLVSVQDAGAQLAPRLLDLRSGQRVLDACAAPGGKTGHLLEACGGGLELTAVDVSEERVALIRENLERLGRTARVLAADLSTPDALSREGVYERILVDAPCSSTGVIRRHPDIKLLRRSSDIRVFADTQLAILRSAAARLTPGGRLLYSTCSVLPEENEQVVERLLGEMPELAAVAMPPGKELAPGAIDCAIGVQLLPGAEAGTDGFYYACLENTTAGT
jgi:16S rRNA (cytosine967-C5)-methyltransferase